MPSGKNTPQKMQTLERLKGIANAKNLLAMAPSAATTMKPMTPASAARAAVIKEHAAPGRRAA
jgi:hypothetical protein